MNTNPNEIYTSPKKRRYKVIRVGKIKGTEKKVWEGRTPVYYWHWYTLIKFLDNGEKIKLKFDYNNNIYDKTKTN